MLGILFALLSATLFASNYVLAQLGMRQSDKDNGVFLSIIINVLVLGIVYGAVLLFRAEPIEWKSTAIFAFITAGLFTSLLGRTSLFSAIRSIGSSRAAAIKNAAPIFTILAAVLFLGETISILSGVGIFIVMTGLFFLAYDQWKQNGKKTGNTFKYGLILAGLSAFFFGTGQAARKFGLLEMADPVLGAWIGAVIALIGFSGSLLYKRQFRETVTSQITKVNKYYILAGVCSSFAVLFFFFSANFIHVSYTSAVAATEPVITVILAYFFLKQQENIQRPIIFSILLVFIGIIVISVSTL